jgi:DNA-binding MarR family transcriptional regulator
LFLDDHPHHPDFPHDARIRMTGRIQQEIRQSKPMALPVEAHLNLQRTATVLRDLIEAETTAVGGLKMVEYNVLRILRGAGDEGLNTEQVRERLMAPDPMLPAVLGSLANRGLVERKLQNRRISEEGLKALATLQAGIDSALAERFSRLSEAEVRTLIGLLERLRD